MTIRRSRQRKPEVTTTLWRISARPMLVELEPASDPERCDHVWITALSPLGGGITRIVINTFSLRNLTAGFDPRVRVGVIGATVPELPEPSIARSAGLNYGELEQQHNIFYEHYSKEAMEAFLFKSVRQAVWLEAWGELYARPQRGLHQVHSRARSCGVLEHYENRDGALKLYRENPEGGFISEMLLFKFCGQ